MYFILRNMFLDFKKQKNNKNKVSAEVLNYLGEGISNDRRDREGRRIE